MATSDLSMECYVVSVPAEYIQSVSLETVILNREKLKFSLGPNSLMINENARVKLGLYFQGQSNIIWGIITFHFKYHRLPMKNCEMAASKRLVQVIIDERVSGNDIVISEDLLFNMDSGRRLNEESIQLQRTYLKLTNEHQCDVVLPTKASKVAISVYQNAYPLDNNILDQTLQRYFSYPRYLCVGDVFSVYLRDHLLDFIGNIDVVHFKVCNLQGLSCPTSSEESCMGYFVDSSVTIYQVSNYQDFFPFKHFPICYKQNIFTLLSDEETMKNLRLYNHNLLPNSFNSLFTKCCSWILPFLYKSRAVKEVGLIPIFLLSGQNGTGKTLLLQALSQYFGMNYWRFDCISVGCAIPGQTEAKLNTILNQLKNVAPCILHLSNFEALYQDVEAKEDVRVMNYFEQEVKKFKNNWPVVIFITTNNCKNISSNINHLFLDTALLSAPSCEQRESIILWLIGCQNGSIKKQELQYVASQTSGFVFRDLQTLVGLAIKEKYMRCINKSERKNEFLLSDFSKIIGMMHKAYSESVGAPKVPSVLWKDVGGLQSLKKEILRSLRSSMFSTGLKRSGLLLHGPPGTGKTLLAKAVATQCGRNFLSIKGPELLNMYVGQSEQNVRDLFELAKVASPSIIFFDELDSLAPNRGRSGDSGGVMDRVVSQLLAEMDDLSTSGDVFILGATNRPDLIDPALLRPGRLDKLLYVGPCEDRSSQLSVITALTHKLCLGLDVSLQEVVSLLPLSVSGAQISALCSAAWLCSARQTILSGKHLTNSPVRVQQEHFLSALRELFNQP